MMGQGIPHGLIVGLEHDLLTFINAVGLFRRNDLLKRPNAFLDGSIGSGISARFNLNLNLDFVIVGHSAPPAYGFAGYDTAMAHNSEEAGNCTGRKFVTTARIVLQ
jgi:hypothetical protein